MAELIVALDTSSPAQAKEMALSLQGHVTWLKVGLELFVAGGTSIVSELKALGFKIFLDLKMYDIPNTVYGGVLAAGALGIDMLTVHAQGGKRMLQAAVLAAEESAKLYTTRPLLMGVTVLTSMEEGELPSYDGTLDKLITKLAVEVKNAGLDGTVSSGHEVVAIKALCGDNFLCLTPGIRCTDTADDQRRTMTPEHAVAVGANFLVVGRPITKAINPAYAAKEIIERIER